MKKSEFLSKFTAGRATDGTVVHRENKDGTDTYISGDVTYRRVPGGAEVSGSGVESVERIRVAMSTAVIGDILDKLRDDDEVTEQDFDTLILLMERAKNYLILQNRNDSIVMEVLRSIEGDISLVRQLKQQALQSE